MNEALLMRLNVSLAIVLTLVSLSGCRSTAEIEADREAQRLALEDKDTKECLSYGAKVGTQEYVACRLKLKEIRQSKANAYTMAPTQGWKKSTCVTQGGYTNCF